MTYLVTPLSRFAKLPLDIVHISKTRPALPWVGRTHLTKGVAMATGTVKWFNPTKGFGFIQPSDGSKDAFVHISAVERAGLHSLREGQKVEYDLVPGRNGKSSAENLVALD